MQKSPFGQLLEQRQSLRDSARPCEQFAPDCLALEMETGGQRRAFPGQDCPSGLAAMHQLPDLEIVEGQGGDGQTSKRSADLLKPAPAPDFERGARRHSLSAMRPLFSPESLLISRVLPDGSEKTEQAHPDGTVRVQIKRPDGGVQEKIADRYGRPFYICDVSPDGKWTVSEMQYHDSPGKISPFTSAKRIITSDGVVSEVEYNIAGRAVEQRKYEAASAG